MVAATFWALFACHATMVPLAAPVAQSPATNDASQSPAGTTIWSSVYTAAQAKRGEATAGNRCAKCHSADLTGGQDGPSLVGQEVLDAWSTGTLGDLFDRIKTTMPADAPQSLSAQETADILAYTLSLNKCPAGEKDLPSDRAALNEIRVTSHPD